MGSELPLSVLFLWHQHQPYYKDPLIKRYELPWVRLHATKDYYDMVALLDEFPKIRLNFNLVPSLLIQLDDYGQGTGDDPFLKLTRKLAKDLTPDDQLFILTHFYMANWENMIDPYPRYRQLLDLRARSSRPEDLQRSRNYFKEQDWRDLQVWFNLAWFDPYWREKDDFIRDLYRKGKNFTEEEKEKLIQKQLSICAEVSAKHKAVAERGQIEITASPFYHPILPLLCDTEAAKMSLPHAALPLQRFQHPEDAERQIQRALEDHERRFGKKPAGMWPSEGSVSDQAAELLAGKGVQWIATDEAVLARSLDESFDRNRHLYEPYRWTKGDKSIQLFFRDHELSDAIGFVYASWKASDAVQDLLQKLRGLRQRLQKEAPEKPHVVSIILDGENCWEYYKEDGLPFLRQLYRALSDEPGIETVLGSEYLNRRPPARVLSRLWSGSWINSNFAIWIGHSEDNRAWDLLSRTRDFLMQYVKDHPDETGSPVVQQAWEEVYVAEGSDWCWWYGSDHSSGNDDTFDALFRKHLMNVYTLLSSKIPENLFVAIKPKRIAARIEPPVDFITPKIDGRITSYYEWNAAGVYHTEAGGSGTMHRAQNLIASVYYGYDAQNLYFRLDLSRPLEDANLQGATFKIIFLAPEGLEATLKVGSEKQVDYQLFRKVGAEKVLVQDSGSAAANKVIELSLPLAHFDPALKQLEWVVAVERNGLEQERWPLDSVVSYPYPSEENFARSWVL